MHRTEPRPPMERARGSTSCTPNWAAVQRGMFERRVHVPTRTYQSSHRWYVVTSCSAQCSSVARHDAHIDPDTKKPSVQAAHSSCVRFMQFSSLSTWRHSRLALSSQNPTSHATRPSETPYSIHPTSDILCAVSFARHVAWTGRDAGRPAAFREHPACAQQAGAVACCCAVVIVDALGAVASNNARSCVKWDFPVTTHTASHHHATRR